MNKYNYLIKAGCVLVLMTMIFAVMKKTGFIEWSWAAVLSPVWAPALLLLVIIVVVIINVAIKMTTVQVQHNLNKAARASSIDAEAAQYGLHRRQGESNAELKQHIAFMKQAERRARHDEE